MLFTMLFQPFGGFRFHRHAQHAHALGRRIDVLSETPLIVSRRSQRNL